MQITAVAEGVEKVEEWSWLDAAGIERFQGFLCTPDTQRCFVD
jgi:EAL domain-containing protein (putative c-di-GMP-specific phosphodiesterase class I)